VPPTPDRARTAGRPENAVARPRVRVRSHDGQAAPGQAVPAEGFARPAVPARTASPAGRPSPRPAGTADPRLAGEPAVLARLVRRVPPTVATGAQVLRGHARMARVGTTQTGARRGRAVSDPVPAARRIGRPEIETTPRGGRPVTGRQDQRATEAAADPRGRPAAATATEAATATAPGGPTEAGAASAAGAAAGSAQASGDQGAVNAPGVATATGAPSAPGPGETRVRPGHPARAGRNCRTRSLPSNSIPMHGPS
jgi:hypothetical protein